jgi:hypothetical protein
MTIFEMAEELSNAAHIFSELASRLRSSPLDSGNTPVHPVTCQLRVRLQHQHELKQIFQAPHLL